MHYISVRGKLAPKRTTRVTISSLGCHQVLIDGLHGVGRGPSAPGLGVFIGDVEQRHDGGRGMSMVVETDIGQVVPL